MRSHGPGPLPADTIFGVDDHPPWPTIAVAAAQHVGLIAINFVVALVVLQAAGVSEATRNSAISMVMIMCGLGTLLQACRRGPFGSGYLMPIVASAVYVGPALAAVQLGGLPLLAGMLMFAGAVEMALSRVLHRLRPFFPPEIAGLVIFLVGTTIAVLGVRDMFGIGSGAAPSLMQGWIAALTLGLMVALQVWGGAWGSLAGPLIGMVLGYAASAAGGLVAVDAFAQVAGAPLLAVPDLSHLGWSFDLRLMIPFALAALASAVKAMGTIALAQRVNDATWVRLEMKSARRGLLSDGLTTFVGGGLGSVVGANPGSGNAGLVLATGVASRQVAWPTGLLLLAMAFVPAASVVFTQMPKPVSGAVLAFSACFIMSNGIQMIASRMLDARRTLVIGLAIGAGLGVEVFPDLARHAPDWLGPVVGSPLVCGMLLGLCLNAVFRIGVRQHATLVVQREGDRAQALNHFIELQGERWGARRDVMHRAGYALDQLIETVIEHGEPRGDITVNLSFDEFSLVARVDYLGTQLQFPEQRPSTDEIVDSPDGVHRLAGFLLRRSADRISAVELAEGCRVEMVFEH